MSANITPQYLHDQASKVRVKSIRIDYNNEAVEGGFVFLEYLSANGDVVEVEKVRFSAETFSNWNGTVAQARNFAISQSQKLDK